MTETRAVYNTGEHKGQLILCQEGQRLFDEYVYRVETKPAGAIATDQAWEKYKEHRKKCKECRYA